MDEISLGVLRRNPEYIQAYRDLPETQKEEEQVAQNFGLPLGMGAVSYSHIQIEI